MQTTLFLSPLRPARRAPAVPPRRMTDPAADDAALLAAAAEGDRRAFDRLVGRHGERVLRLALRVLGDANEAEEVAQEALLRAWRAAATFDPDRARVTTWLHRITLNLAIDRARRRRPATGGEAELAALVDPGAGPEANLAAAEDRAALAAAIADLPPRQRAAIALSYEEGLSGAEAAAALAVSERALEGLLHRARDVLRRKLAR